MKNVQSIESASYLLLHMGKCMVCHHGKEKHLWFNYGNRFYGFIALFAKVKDVLSWLVIFGKIDTNLLDKKWVWRFWAWLLNPDRTVRSDRINRKPVNTPVFYTYKTGNSIFAVNPLNRGQTLRFSKPDTGLPVASLENFTAKMVMDSFGLHIK